MDLKSDTNKSFDEYRNNIKYLKQKIKEQMTQNDSLQRKMEKMQPDHVNSSLDQSVDQEDKKNNKRVTFQEITSEPQEIKEPQEVMDFFKNSFESVGISLEFLFRAVDIKDQNVIFYSDFKQFLYKNKLGIDSRLVNQFLNIINDDLSETLTFEAYLQSLFAYKVNILDAKLQMWKLGKNYISSFVAKLIEKDITAEKAWSIIDYKNNKKIYSDDFCTFYKVTFLFKNIDPLVEEKYCLGVYQFLDMKKQNYVLEETFLTAINKQINLLTQDDDSVIKNTEFIFKKLIEKSEKNILDFIRSLLLFIRRPEHGPLFSDFQQINIQYSSALELSELFQLFRYFDTDKNGIISYREFLRFLVNFKNKECKDYSLYLIIVSRIRESEEKMCFKSYLLDLYESSTEINPEVIKQIVKPYFTVPDTEIAQIYQHLLNIAQMEKMTIQDLLNLTYNFSNIQVFQKKVSQQEVKETKKLTEEDLQSLTTFIDDIKKEFVEEDFHKIGKNSYKTIFTNEIACMKGYFNNFRCLDFISNMKKNNLERWEDSEFGPNETDPSAESSLYFCHNSKPNGSYDPDVLNWVSFEKINPQSKAMIFNFEGANASDVQQGALGDCWFMSALSILASNNDDLLHGNLSNIKASQGEGKENQLCYHMLEGTMPPMFQFLQQFGIYVFKFYKNNNWLYVCIDDRLPILQSDALAYANSPFDEEKNEQEFWVSFIEKAYAKLHGCYQSLISGEIDEALADLTSMPPQKVNIQKKCTNSDEFWEMLKDLQKYKSMIGCSANGGTEGKIYQDGEESGMRTGHAYSILKIFELDKLQSENSKREFHRLRNPWGYGESKIKWSDEDPKKQIYKDKLQEFFLKQSQIDEKYESIKEDGQFNVCFKDWRTLFNNLFICFHYQEGWSSIKWQDSWSEGSNFGFPKTFTPENCEAFAKQNNQYIFEVNNETDIMLIVKQQDGRLIRGLKYPFKEVVKSYNLMIFKLDEEQNQLEKFDKSLIVQMNGKFQISRQICIPKFTIQPGKYCIITRQICNESLYENNETGNYSFELFFDKEKHQKDISITKVNASEEMQVTCTDLCKEEDFKYTQEQIKLSQQIQQFLDLQ